MPTVVPTQSNPTDLAMAKAGRRGPHNRHNGLNGHHGHHGYKKGDKPGTRGVPPPGGPEVKDPPAEPDTTNPETTDADGTSDKPIILAYDCCVPKAPAEFPQVEMPIPYLETLPLLVGWTDAFVHRIGELVLTEQREKSSLESEKKDLTAKIEELNREISNLKSRLDGTGDPALLKRIEELEDLVGRLGRQIFDLEFDLGAEKDKVAALEKERDLLQRAKEYADTLLADARIERDNALSKVEDLKLENDELKIKNAKLKLKIDQAIIELEYYDEGYDEDENAEFPDGE